jgi:hypothetical protein
MLIVNLYCSTVRALAMPYNKVMLIKPNKAKALIIRDRSLSMVRGGGGGGGVAPKRNVFRGKRSADPTIKNSKI